MDPIVDHGRQKIVGCGDGMDVSGKMKVNLFTGNDHGFPSAGGSPFYAEHRSERRLPQGDTGLLSETVQRVRQPDGRGSFSFASRSGGHGRDHDQFPLLLRKKRLIINFCLVAPIKFKPVLGNAQPGSNLVYRSHPALLLRQHLTRTLFFLQLLSAALTAEIHAVTMRLIFFNQALIGKAEIAIVSDDDVVKNPNLHEGAGKDQVAGDVAVAARRFRVT